MSFIMLVDTSAATCMTTMTIEHTCTVQFLQVHYGLRYSDSVAFDDKVTLRNEQMDKSFISIIQCRTPTWSGDHVASSHIVRAMMHQGHLEECWETFVGQQDLTNLRLGPQRHSAPRMSGQLPLRPTMSLYSTDGALKDTLPPSKLIHSLRRGQAPLSTIIAMTRESVKG